MTPQQGQSMSLKFQGKSYPEISRAIGISAGTIRNWYTHSGALYDVYRDYCASVMHPPVAPGATHTDAANVGDRIRQLASPAIETVASVMSGANTRADVKLAAAKDILDRAGYQPVQKMLALHVIDDMPMDQLDAFVSGILAKHEALAIAADVPIDIANTTPDPLPTIYKEGGDTSAPTHTTPDTLTSPAATTSDESTT